MVALYLSETPCSPGSAGFRDYQVKLVGESQSAKPLSADPATAHFKGILKSLQGVRFGKRELDSIRLIGRAAG
jgi:hypothetical protein